MDLESHIDRQLDFNAGKNILNKNAKSLFGFTSEVNSILPDLQKLDNASRNKLVDYATHKVIQEFCRVNQYYSFNADAVSRLREIYSSLFDSIAGSGSNELREISERHFLSLQKWLSETNNFALKIYSSNETFVEPVVCSEYSAGFQLEIFDIELSYLKQPVLDIGCGKQGALVYFLNSKGIQASGIDRLVDTLPDCQNADWLEFDYEKQKWGTIISNMSFSNHFRHHHFRADGDYLKYAAKYMEILQSLKPGGAFYYAPGLPFIEDFLDSEIYKIEILETGNAELHAVKILRMK